MYDTIHIQIEAVELLAIWILARHVNGQLRLGTIWSRDPLGILLLDRRDDLWVLLRQPSEQGWHAHVGGEKKGGWEGEAESCEVMERKKGGRREQQAVDDEIHLGGRGDKAAPRNTQRSAKHAYRVADDSL